MQEEAVHQHHFGKKFYLDRKKGYWISTTEPRVRAHVWVWKCHYGEIEEGYHIHHIDEDKSNNDLSNLKKIHASTHLSMHMTEERREFSRNWAAVIRPMTKEWHASKEGLEWHRKNGIEAWENRKPIKISCEQCGKSSLTKTYFQQFCSNNCKSRHRRLSGVDDIEKECPICHIKHIKNKYAKGETCGRKCGRKLIKIRKKEREAKGLLR